MNAPPIIRDLFRPLMLMVMSACLALALTALVNLSPIRWNGPFLAVFCALVALEAYYSERATRAFYTLGDLRTRLVELGALFVLLQLGTDLTRGEAPFRHFQPVIDPMGIAYAVAAGILWLMAYDSASELERLGEPPGHDLRYHRPQHALWLRFLAGMGLIVIATSVVQVQESPAQLVRAGAVPPAVVLVIFTLAGVFLLAQAHYSSLSVTWREAGVLVPPAMPGRWARYAIGFILALTLLAFFMPAAGASQLLAAFGVIGAGLAWLLTHLARGGSAPKSRTGFFARPPARSGHIHRGHPPPPAHLPNLLPALEVMAAIAVVVGLAVFAWRIAQEAGKPGARKGGFWARALAAVADAWRAFLGWLRGTGSELAAMLPAVPGGDLVLGAAAPLTRVFRRRPSTERGRVIAYYLEVLERTGKYGFTRRPSETAREFEQDVARREPRAQSDIGIVTDAFLEARYSRHDVQPSALDRMKTAWQSMRRTFEGKT